MTRPDPSTKLALWWLALAVVIMLWALAGTQQ